MNKKVLVVEDDKDYHEYYKQALDNKVIIISALTIEDARRIFAENPDLGAIVMDACVPGRNPTTLGLTEEFRKIFKGPMIAVSNDEDFREMLMKKGCDHESKKRDVPHKVLAVLSLI